MRIGLVACELSGDRLGAALIEAVRARHPDVEFEGIAGPRMREAGCRPLARAEQIGVMGLAEVLTHLPRLLRLRRRVFRHFRDHPPDVFVGIDAPDFNLSLERRLKRCGIPALHWVSPSVWAWRRYRVRKIRRSVDLLMTLFPFEARFCEQHRLPAQFVGHPMADEIGPDPGRAVAREALSLDVQGPLLALLPGSRAGEVKRLLPLFLQAARLCHQALPGLRFVLPAATPQLLERCRAWLQRRAYRGLPVTLLQGQAREAMQAADLVLLASGTATLECMLLKRPMLVTYRVHPLSHLLLKRLLAVPFVSLPNLLLGRRQVPEYLQHDAGPAALAKAALELLREPQLAARQTEPFDEIHRQLRCDAAARTAAIVLQRGMH
ncbi:MAG: lipid-A-disaccharide synthase [Thiogranum sp.]|nr:lipid-A-disaccharide synthase [Thiogranum sp.]